MLIGDRWFEGGVNEAIDSMFTWKNAERGRPLSSPLPLDLIPGGLNKPHTAGRSEKSEPRPTGVPILDSVKRRTELDRGAHGSGSTNVSSIIWPAGAAKVGCKRTKSDEAVNLYL